MHDPGVVDEDVERAELRLDGVEERSERLAVGDVELEGLDARRRAPAAVAWAGSRSRSPIADLHALAHHRLGGGLADAARAAGDGGHRPVRIFACFAMGETMPPGPTRRRGR